MAWEMEDIKAMDLKRYAWHLREDSDKGVLDHESLVEGLSEHKQVAIPPDLASGFYEAHRILTDYGFSPVGSDTILLLRQVRAALEESFGLSLDALNVAAPRAAQVAQ